MIHPHTRLHFINDEIGHGVIATQTIPAGTITWVRDPLDREITPLEVEQLATVCQTKLETYTYRNQHGNFFLCWDIARYMNHSFRPNCMVTAYGFEVAVRTIKAGEELTNDYGMLNIVEPFRATDEGTRRKTVYPDDLQRYHQRWDQTLEKVFTKIPSIEQPLHDLVSDEIWQHLHDINSGSASPKSLLGNFFNSK